MLGQGSLWSWSSHQNIQCWLHPNCLWHSYPKLLNCLISAQLFQKLKVYQKKSLYKVTQLIEIHLVIFIPSLYDFYIKRCNFCPITLIMPNLGVKIENSKLEQGPGPKIIFRVVGTTSKWEIKFGRHNFFLKTSSLFVLSDAGNFKQFFSIFRKKIENFSKSQKFSKSQNFSSFSKN